MDILREQQFMYVKVNLNVLSGKEQQDPSLYMHTNDLKEIYKDKETIIYQINGLTN